RPTVIAAHLACASICGQWKTNSKACGNAYRPGIADEDGVKVRAVAASSITGVVDVTASPTLAGLVVFYGCNNMVIDGTCFLQVSFSAGRIYYFLRPLLDL